MGLPKAVSPCWKSSGYCRPVMVAGSRLSIVRTVSVPGPALRCAMPINQLVEKNLSAPRGPDCCSSVTKTLAWNISVQAAFFVMSMGTGVELGWALVPEASWSRISSRKFWGSMPGMFAISAAVMPGMFCVPASLFCCAKLAKALAREMHRSAVSLAAMPCMELEPSLQACAW